MTLSALGIFSAAGAGGGFSSDYELIETQILGSSQSSITFSGLGTYSSTYKHLQLRMVTKYDNLINATDFYIRFNGDTGANYSHHRMLGNGSSVSSTGAANTNQIFAGFIADEFHSIVLDILDPYSTTKNKTTRSLLGLAGTTVKEVMLTSGNWRSTSSVTSITLLPLSPRVMVAGTRLSLYGIK
jgi:hypothetical protein